MKKSFFGFSAKVAMAVLAVCSFVLTSCYEKSPGAKTPTEYHVIGSVYDAVTGEVQRTTCVRSSRDIQEGFM